MEEWRKQKGGRPATCESGKKLEMRESRRWEWVRRGGVEEERREKEKKWKE